MPETATPVEEMHAPEATLDENLALMTQQTDRLEAELDSFADTGAHPDWWHDEALPRQKVVAEQLQDEGARPEQISEYFVLRGRQQQVRAQLGRRNYGFEPIAAACNELGEAVVAKGLAAEAPDGPIRTAMLERLAQSQDERDRRDLKPELEILRQSYELETTTDLLALGGDEYTDNLRPLLRTEKAVKRMRIADQEPESPEDTWLTKQAKAHRWMSRALSVVAGMDEAEAADYAFAASRGGKDVDVIAMLDRFDHFGAERLRDIADFTNIHAFEAYSVDQLELMEDLAKNPEEAAKRLARHDVNVVMVNRVGDYSGVLHDSAATYEDGNGRTLFFEINSMGDIYRHMLKLQKRGVQPSTLALAAHSAPGQFVVADVREPAAKRRDIATIAGRNLVKFVAQNDVLPEGSKAYAMHGMKGMARMVEDLMQPSRAIDDVDADKGKKKLLFQACNAATEDEAVDMDENGDKFTTSMDSVVSRLGHDLIDSGVQSDVDIYGAPEKVQLRKSKTGVRYTSNPESNLDRQPQSAIRVRVAGGVFTQEDVDEVVLHKAA